MTFQMSQDEIFSSDYEYIKSKTEILETCDCAKQNICGICFWKGVTISPEIGINNKCRRCLADMQKFKEKVKNASGKIDYEPICFTSCMWWDWFHNLRKQIALQNNVTFNYKRKQSQTKQLH